MAALLQYFLMAAFCWMLVEGIYLYLFVVKVYNIVDKMRVYQAISWGKDNQQHTLFYKKSPLASPMIRGNSKHCFFHCLDQGINTRKGQKKFTLLEGNKFKAPKTLDSRVDI